MDDERQSPNDATSPSERAVRSTSTALTRRLEALRRQSWQELVQQMPATFDADTPVSEVVAGTVLRIRVVRTPGARKGPAEFPCG